MNYEWWIKEKTPLGEFKNNNFFRNYLGNSSFSIHNS